jgi:asparagine synthase (glutamine-hydrolysing)
MVATRYRTRHHPFQFGAEVMANTARLAWFHDEPFADSSSLVTFALAGETRKRVTVALTGDGSDEILLGYARYFRYGQMRRGTLPARTRQLPSLYRLPPAGSEGHLAACDCYGLLLDKFREQHKLDAYDIGMMPHLRKCSYERLLPWFVEHAEPEDQASRMDIGQYLPDDLCVKVDIAAMAHGLETRSPFLRHEVVEFALRIPPQDRVWDGEGKALLKLALEPLLPHECLYREKRGFRVPVAQFLREEMREEVAALLLSDRCLDRGLFNPDAIRHVLDRHNEGREDHGSRIWALLMLELWHRTWVDEARDAPLSGADAPFAGWARACRAPA